MKIYLPYLFLFITTISSAQKVSVSIDRKPSLVQSIANPISISAKNCQDYVLTTDNGKIEQSNSDCKFTIYPNHAGLAKITIKNKAEKLINEELYNVKPIAFSVEIPGFNKYINDVNHFSNAAKLSLHSDDLECSDISWLANFELIIVDENKTTRLSAQTSNGNLNELKDNFKTLKKGNIIIFHNIKVIAGTNEFNLLDIVLEVN